MLGMETFFGNPLSEQYDFEAFSASQVNQDILLFGLDERGKLKVFSSHQELEPGPGWTVISLVNEKTEPNP